MPHAVGILIGDHGEVADLHEKQRSLVGDLREVRFFRGPTLPFRCRLHKLLLGHRKIDGRNPRF